MTDLSDIRSAVGAVARDVGEGLLGDLLSTGPSQHTRLLRFHTPLGADALVAERAHITEGIGPYPHLGASAFGIELFALGTNARLSPADLIGQAVLLEMLTAHSRNALRPFHGHVLAFELLGSDGGLARYRLRIGAWLDVLRHRVDSRVFQDQSVVDITESVLADHVGQGALQPAWRWDLREPAVYPRLSIFSQHEESDFDFLKRLWAANGLFYWFEHTGTEAEAALGSHTLVIADHNGAFAPNLQDRIRYTQPGAVMKEDCITRWHAVRRVGVSALHTASHDYRCVASHAGSAEADRAHAQPMPLVHADQPGAYAFETPEEAERIALMKLQSLEAQRLRFQGRGTVRTLAPATTFMLDGHAGHDLFAGQEEGEEARRFAVLSVVHQVRNNLSADAKAGLQHLLGPDKAFAAGSGASGRARGRSRSMVSGGESGKDTGTGADKGCSEPLYEARFVALPLAVPCRAPMQDEQGRLLHPRPTARGTQTALVVGRDSPIHTDRDGRVKVQFHWQRGAEGSHRQRHPAGDNAPASDASGTWVRVAQDWAGANWGGVFTPRLGQEVIVAFIEGDIDRPVIVGAVYNGEGHENAQGNRVGGGAARATGNAPAWFPGSERHDDMEGHAHAAALSGFKSQSLEASQAGGGGHNQLVFDDSPDQGRVLAHTTQSRTWLQIGHLLQQHDNLRLARRGHGLELHTNAQGALRAGSGLHVSTHASARGSDGVQGQPTQTCEVQGQLQAHAELLRALSESAQTHLAKLPREPAADSLQALRAMQATLNSLQGVEGSDLARSSMSRGTDTDADAGTDARPGEGATAMAIDGGHGRIPVTRRPDLVMGAAADIGSLTPCHTVIGAGQHTTILTGQDTNFLTQQDMAWAVKDGVSLFTRGEAKDGDRAVQDVGMKLHAASGNVNVQAQADAFQLTAEKAIDVQSTAADVVISAPNRIMLNGGGGYIRIEGGDIEIGTSGPAVFKGGMKELTGGASACAVHRPVMPVHVEWVLPHGACTPSPFETKVTPATPPSGSSL